jgi:hypothetical protein
MKLIKLTAILSIAFTCLTSTTAIAQNTQQAATKNPFSPSFQHEYRHGAIPTIDAKDKIDTWRKNNLAPAKISDKTLFL